MRQTLYDLPGVAVGDSQEKIEATWQPLAPGLAQDSNQRQRSLLPQAYRVLPAPRQRQTPGQGARLTCQCV